MSTAAGAHGTATIPSDLLILGGGPAGGTAALYAARIGRTVRVLGGTPTDSQIAAAMRIDNFPGIDGLNGSDFLENLRRQAISAGSAWEDAHAVSLTIENRLKHVTDDQGRIWSGKTLLIATGSAPIKPEVPGIDRLWGRGVSLCAWCDGPFFKGKTVAILGGGNSAYSSVEALERIAGQVHLLLPKRGDQAFSSYRKRSAGNPRVSIHRDVELVSCEGDSSLSSVRLKVGGEDRHLPVDALFISIGQTPRTAFLPSSIARTADGFIRCDAQGRTDLPGVFAAGDVVEGQFRQLITACGSGATAALACDLHLSRLWSDPTHA